MKFTNVSFTPALQYDKEYFETAIQLQNTGAAFFANHAPEMQPLYEGGKNKRLPIAFLTLKWTYKINDRDNKTILNYNADDKYHFNPQDYTHQDIRELVAISFDSMANHFHKSSIEGIFLDEIPEPTRTEFENLCLYISQFLQLQIG